MLIGYARVSTQEQNLHLQRDALLKAGCERIFEEKRSGAVIDRLELINALKYIRQGDTLVVWKFDRLGRSLKQHEKCVKSYFVSVFGEEKGVGK